MSRDYSLYLEDIIESCQRISRYTQGMSLEKFRNNEMAYDAVLRNIEIIGEAAKRIPTIIRDQYVEIEWRRIAGMRDVVAHHYFSIHDNIVWDIVVNKIPDLTNQVKKILDDMKT